MSSSLSKISRQISTSSPLAPFNPIRLTKKSCLFLLRAVKSMSQLKQIHCQILVSNLLRTNSIADRLMLFLADPDTGDADYASHLLLRSNLPNPSLFHYNLLVRAHFKNGNIKNALSIFTKMREEGFSPDSFTYPFVLKSVSDGRNVHAVIVKSGLEPDPYVGNSLVEMYADTGNIACSRQLFDEMPRRDVISWNVLIAGLVRCREFDAAVSVFYRMEAEGVVADEATLVSTLSACVPLQDLNLGERICQYMNEKVGFSVILGNALLDMYCKCGSLDTARRFFVDMPARNVVSWTAMVSGYVNAGLLDDARELFDRSPTRDVVLWTAMINGYVQYNRFEEALSLFREMQMKRIKPDKFTVVSLLTVCANLGALEQGTWIHGYIEDNKIQIDAVVGTALIDMYAKCGCIDKSLEIFFGKVEGKKDSATWTSVICGLAMNGQTEKALELFAEMKMFGVPPDDITFIGVLSACNHGGLVEEGRRYFYAMEEVYRIEPKLEHYGCLIDLLGRVGLLDEAEALIEKLPSANDGNTLPVWGSLLGACRIHGNVEMSERVAKRLAGIDSANSGVHSLVANIYASAERWEDVNRVRRKMKDLGMKKTPGCSSIEVNGAISEFLVGDTSHSGCGDIYLALNSISRIMDLEVKAVDTDMTLMEVVV